MIMKNLIKFSVASLMMLILTVSCKKDEVLPQNPQVVEASLNDLNQNNVLDYFEAIKLSEAQQMTCFMNNLRTFPDPTSGILIIDSLSNPTCNDDQIPGYAPEFTNCEGKTIISINGQNIFSGFWGLYSSSGYRIKAMVTYGSRKNCDFSLLKIQNAVNEAGVNTLDYKLFIIGENTREANLLNLAEPGYASIRLLDIRHWKDNIILMEIISGTDINNGPHQLVAFDLRSEKFKKFNF